jgi:hypothetical protein
MASAEPASKSSLVYCTATMVSVYSLGMDGTGNWYVSVSMLRMVYTTQMVCASIAEIRASFPKGGT